MEVGVKTAGNSQFLSLRGMIRFRARQHNTTQHDLENPRRRAGDV